MWGKFAAEAGAGVPAGWTRVRKHMPILCLSLEKCLELLILLHVQHNGGLMMALVDAGEGPDGFGGGDDTLFLRSWVLIPV